MSRTVTVWLEDLNGPDYLQVRTAVDPIGNAYTSAVYTVIEKDKEKSTSRDTYLILRGYNEKKKQPPLVKIRTTPEEATRAVQRFISMEAGLQGIPRDVWGKHNNEVKRLLALEARASGERSSGGR